MFNKLVSKKTLRFVFWVHVCNVFQES